MAHDATDKRPTVQQQNQQDRQQPQAVVPVIQAPSSPGAFPGLYAYSLHEQVRLPQAASRGGSPAVLTSAAHTAFPIYCKAAGQMCFVLAQSRPLSSVLLAQLTLILSLMLWRSVSYVMDIGLRLQGSCG
jgi:hypothetical protein